jgi:ElaB/YqjD/DUF883 family membrane-anchored ribosome-binding protein
MSLQSTAQELIVVDPASMGSPMGHAPMQLVPLEVMDPEPTKFSPEDFSPMEVSEPAEIEIVIEELPGAPKGTHDPEPILEVSEEDGKDKSDLDENDAKKPKKNEKWDWEAHGPTGFVAWIKARIDDVPKHSGYDSAGLERAVSYMERLDNEISRAMRLDLDGELDANKIEAVRSQIDDGLSRLHDRLDKVKKHSKSRRKKKADADYSLVKEAQKITGVQGIYVTVPLLISRVARVCINGMVSAGHDIEDIYAKQVKKYKLSDREQAETMQLLADMGYPLRQDRGYMPDEDVDFASSDNMDWAANYKG